MLPHVWSVLCYKGVVDRFSNNVSLLDVIDELTLTPIVQPAPDISGTVIVPMNLCFVNLWRRTDPEAPETVQARQRICSRRGAVSEWQDLTIDLTKHIRSRLITRLPGWPYDGPGHYRYIVQHQRISASGRTSWKTVAEIPLEIKLGKPEPESQAD